MARVYALVASAVLACGTAHELLRMNTKTSILWRNAARRREKRSTRPVIYHCAENQVKHIRAVFKSSFLPENVARSFQYILQKLGVMMTRRIY